MGKGEIDGCFSVKKCLRTDWKGGKMLGRRWKCWQEELFLKGTLKGNKDKGELAKMKVRPIIKVYKHFTLEDYLSIEDN